MRVFATFACFALAGSTAAAAQKPTPAPAPKKVTPDDTCTTVEPGRIECRRIFERAARNDSVLMKRSVLGVNVSATGSSRDTLGLFVTSVSSKGPAENAGIVEGDRLVSINGVDLRVPAADLEDGYASGLPARRLQREVSKVTPGTRVNLRVYSGGRIRDVQVTTGRASDLKRPRTVIGFGDWAPGSMIWGDDFNMAPLANMRIMEGGPEWDRMRIEMPKLRQAFPKIRMQDGEWRKMIETLPDFRRMHIEDFPMLEPGHIYRLRSPERMRIEKENADKDKKSKN